ncbi:hypothetical protein VTH06DRAFT_2789 [Thermothelomyces fergusii]
MAQRNLLLCFDAFGTLFHPKRPVMEQYVAVAQQCGLRGFGVRDVELSFKAAFSRESELHPNYGRASGIGALKWWTNVITQTFRPLIGEGTELPSDLAPKLWHRFSSGEGYTLSPGVASLLRSLRQRQRERMLRSPRLVVGVITNSDDRVPTILSSLGLHVSPFGFGTPLDLVKGGPCGRYDVDLHCMSYDVGVTKPDRRIFDAAEEMAVQLVMAQEAAERGRDVERAQSALPWLKLYVGDEYEKDVIGARGAGWNPIFVGAKEVMLAQDGVVGLDQLRNKSLDQVFHRHGPPLTIHANSVQETLNWLIGQ